MTSYIDYNKHTHDYVQKVKRNGKKRKLTKKVNSESLPKGVYLGKGQYTVVSSSIDCRDSL